MLFKDSTIFKQYAQLSAEVDFTAIKPTIEFVEDKHLVPIISKEQFTALNTAYTNTSNENSLTTAQKNLLHACRKLIAPYVCYYYAPKVDVTLSDGGVRRAETNSHKTAFQYQLKNFMESQLNEAEGAHEALLAFLEENKADYTQWVNSQAFKSYRGRFIKTPMELYEIFPTASPFRVYWAVASKMKDVEELNIKPLLGETLFNSLKEKATQTSPTFTDVEKQLLALICRAIAPATIAYAIPFLNVRVDHSGLSITASDARSTNDNISSRAQANADAINNYITSAQMTARAWKSEIKAFLNTHQSTLNWQPSVSTDVNQSLHKTFGLT
ncbi:MAG TPA: hypothetical protein PKY29_04430 [Ferruginibacter sp.]|nr:hypothetical protein [Ferruginibacter sp.]HRQ20535.1 hypothetical protein [Ferruginibacter sp.]